MTENERKRKQMSKNNKKKHKIHRGIYMTLCEIDL